MCILAHVNQGEKSKKVGIKEILLNHYKIYGRNFFTRYDYEEVDGAAAGSMMAHLQSQLSSKSLVGNSFGQFTVSTADDFTYEDPIDKSVSKNQVGNPFMMPCT